MASVKTTVGRDAIERHYDSLAFLYRTFWGEHIHHGLWPARGGSPLDAQVRLVSHLTERAGIRRGEQVLDVGCGYGAPARWLAGHLDCRVTGITISGRQAAIARRENQRAGLAASVSVVRADAAALPIADSSYDVVWVIECIEHLADKGRFVDEVARILRPGGRFALCTWQDAGVEDEEQRGRLVGGVCDAFLCPSLATADDYRTWCTSAGLEVRRIEDLTPRVRATWEILGRRVGRPWLRPFRLLVGRHTRRFIDGFSIIAEAYETGAMSYGLLVAAKPR